MSFEQLVEDYRKGNPSSQVRSPDIGDVVKRAHRHRRRQVAGGVLSVALVAAGGTIATEAVVHKSPVVAPTQPRLTLVASQLTGTSPHFVGDTRIDLPVTYGVAGRDSLWLVGKKGDNGWQLMKIGAPEVAVTVRVTVPSEPIGIAATQRYVWVGVNGADGPQLLQYGADGSALHVYPLAAAPVAVHAVDSGTAWVTEGVNGGVQVARFDGDKQTAGVTSKLIAGTPGTPATVMGGDKIFVHTRVGNDTRLVAISSRTLALLPKWSLDFGASTVRDIAFTDPLYFAATDGPQQGFSEAPLVVKTGYPATTATSISTLPTYKVSTTNDHAWALSMGPNGSVLSRYDRATHSIGATLPTPTVAADKVSVMVVDLNYIWLVQGDKISVFGPS